MPTDTAADQTSTPGLKEFLDKTLVPRGADAVTAAADLCAHARIAPTLRNAALNLVGADLYKKVKPPGDTTLYSNNAWSLESLASARPQGGPAPAFTPQQLAAAFSLAPGQYVLPEAAKGQR